MLRLLIIAAISIAILACGTSSQDAPTSSSTSVSQAATTSPEAGAATTQPGAQSSAASGSPTLAPSQGSGAADSSSPATVAQDPTVEAVDAAEQASAPISDSAGVPTLAPTAAPAKAAIIMVRPSIGTDVGKTLPQFDFTLFNGTTKSTARLSSQGRPVFLFFLQPGERSAAPSC